jgi:homoserine dehydrogenase
VTDRQPAIARVILCGFGNVGSAVLELLRSTGTRLHGDRSLHIRVVGVAELGGAAFYEDGLDLTRLVEARAAGEPVWSIPDVGREGMTAVELLRALEADCVVDATPMQLDTGMPGLAIAREAIALGRDLVLANKAPLALAFDELTAGAQWIPHGGLTSRRRLRFSATVAGSLPAIALGHALTACRIERIEAVLNGTSHLLLRLMERGIGYEDALGMAQAKGMAEADPSLDVDGWDSAGKLVILSNAVLGHSCTLSDVEVEGIRGLSATAVAEAQAAGQSYVLLAIASRDGDGWLLTVKPVALMEPHPLALLGQEDMGIVYVTDHVPRLTATTTEPDAVPAAVAVLRDIADIYTPA